MARLLHNFSEAAQFLDTDNRGLRQIFAYEFKEYGEVLLPAYVESSARDFFCRLSGDAIAKQGDAEEYDVDALLKSGDHFGMYGADDLCSWEQLETSREVSGFPAVYGVRGLLRVCPVDVIRACKNGYFDGSYIYPPSWFSENSPMGFDSSNLPGANFLPLSAFENTFGYRGPIKEFDELVFFESDLKKIIRNRETEANQAAEPDSINIEKDKNLRQDAIETYERIIAALWIKAHGNGGSGMISNKPHTAAASLAKLLANNGISKPDADTIGKRLAASKNVGLKIGSSDEIE